MALNPNFTPRGFFPDCIRVYRQKGLVLNAVGLSGPGAETLFGMGRWQAREKPFFLSFMSTAAAKAERLDELTWFVGILKKHLYFDGLLDRVGLQLNYSCPNTGHEIDELVGEIYEGLTIAGELGIPLMPKLNVLTPVKTAIEISEHPECDALCISNTIPYGKLPERIPWEKLFGPVSPLAKYGGGGLSGRLLLPILLDWLGEAITLGIKKPINAGGGILSENDAMTVLQLLNGGEHSIFLGSVAMLYPWRVEGIIKKVNAANIRK